MDHTHHFPGHKVDPVGEGGEETVEEAIFGDGFFLVVELAQYRQAGTSLRQFYYENISSDLVMDNLHFCDFTTTLLKKAIIATVLWYAG